MVCCTVGCTSAIYPPPGKDHFSHATENAWRHWKDDKKPKLPQAVAFCPACIEAGAVAATPKGAK